MSNLPGTNKEWQAFSKMMQGAFPENPLPFLAKWGTQQDNAIRDGGTRIQSPTIDPESKLNFEQRILKPNSYPSIDNGDGSISTHRMAWGGDEGNYMAFPTIVQGKDGKLLEMDSQQAMEHAQKTGEYRKFDKPEDAASYAEGGYKKFWGLGEKKK
jgi:hypothetical protein